MKSNSSSSGHKLILLPLSLFTPASDTFSDAIDAAAWLNTETKHNTTGHRCTTIVLLCVLCRRTCPYTPYTSSSIRSLIKSVSQSLLLLKMYSETQQLFNTHTELLITYSTNGAIREVIMGCNNLLDNETLPSFSPNECRPPDEWNFFLYILSLFYC